MTSQLISWFNERDLEGSLNTNPEYQRNPVWSYKNKKYLVDSVIRGLPIPEIFMQIKTDSDGKSEYIIIDGQQRIRAILEFINGEYDIDEKDNREFGGKYFKELPTGVQQEFWKFKLHVREVNTNSDAEIRAIFKRMNKNVVPLNKQELRNATYIGYFIKMMNQLADEQEFFSENGIFTANDIKRMLDAEFISELFILLMHGIQNKKDNLDGYYKIYDDEWPDRKERKKEYNRIITLISDILETLKGTRWRVKNDFYSLFYALNELNKEYFIPPENYIQIGTTLNEFSKQVIMKGEDSKNEQVKKYFIATSHIDDKGPRENRYKILRELIIPHLIPRDKKRHYTEEERLLVWAQSNEKCGICGKKVKWKDFEVDHIDPHSKGGLTVIPNAQITHKTCNASKSDKT